MQQERSLLSSTLVWSRLHAHELRCLVYCTPANFCKLRVCGSCSAVVPFFTLPNSCPADLAIAVQLPGHLKQTLAGHDLTASSVLGICVFVRSVQP